MTDERMIDVPGARLHARADGDGPPIVLVHAGIVDSRAWDPLVPLLTGAGYRAIRYDTRGFGRSDTEDVEFSNRDDLVAVLDAFGVGQACLVGNSRGAMIAFDTAVEFPERAAAVVLIGGGIGGYEAEPTREEAAAFEEMEALEEAGTDPETMADFQFRLWIDGLRQPEGRVGPPTRDWLRPMVVGTCDPSRVYGRPIPLRPPAAERLDAATMPILAIHGALDVSDIEATGRHLATTLPNARFEIVPGVAHLIAVEAPGRVAELILQHVHPLGAFG
jgi:pimeloyl-ACP methyl ester carboxylesterase